MYRHMYNITCHMSTNSDALEQQCRDSLICCKCKRFSLARSAREGEVQIRVNAFHFRMSKQRSAGHCKSQWPKVWPHACSTDNASFDLARGPPSHRLCGLAVTNVHACRWLEGHTGTHAGASGQSPQEHLKAASQHAGMVSFITVIPAGVFCSPGKSIWYGAPMRVGCLSLISPRKSNHSWKLCAPPPTS